MNERENVITELDIINKPYDAVANKFKPIQVIRRTVGSNFSMIVDNGLSRENLEDSLLV